MINTILVPIDVAHEEAGTGAMDYAKELAEKHGGKLVLLNVREMMPGYVAAHLPADFQSNALAEARDSLKAFADRHGAKSAEIVIREGNAATEILDYANEIKADMIVVASHDPGFADYFLGSTAARVVRHAHCSVLVVRKT